MNSSNRLACAASTSLAATRESVYEEKLAENGAGLARHHDSTPGIDSHHDIVADHRSQTSAASTPFCA